uniref:Uncharacterized protein n=1 Tax=Ixodes ricinus TaxID=34613 RepID=A0A6B0UNG5_IXORI
MGWPWGCVSLERRVFAVVVRSNVRAILREQVVYNIVKLFFLSQGRRFSIDGVSVFSRCKRSQGVLRHSVVSSRKCVSRRSQSSSAKSASSLRSFLCVWYHKYAQQMRRNPAFFFFLWFGF